jgi:hypothetical protein
MSRRSGNMRLVSMCYDSKVGGQGMDELKQNHTLVLALVGIGVVIVIIGLWFAWATASRHRSERLAILREREMAVIAERVETTGGGRLCILLLMLTVIGTVFAYSQATTVSQQIEAGRIVHRWLHPVRTGRSSWPQPDLPGLSFRAAHGMNLCIILAG